MSFERKLGETIDVNVPSHEYVFKRMFKCVVSQMDITSKEYLKKFGVFTTGDPGIDREMANQPIVTYKTIADMVDLFRQGITVRIPSQTDCKTIYEYVDYHIQSWAQAVQNGLNLGSAPLEDLVEMDKFATKLYPYALNNQHIMENTTVFMKHVGNTYANIDNVLGSTSIIEPPKDTEDDNLPKMPQRESFAELFISRGRSWK